MVVIADHVIGLLLYKQGVRLRPALGGLSRRLKRTQLQPLNSTKWSRPTM